MTDAANDPVGSVRDCDPDNAMPDEVAHVNRYAIKWSPPLDLDEDRPWVFINHEAGLQRMPNDLMDRYPVVPLAELARRLGHGSEQR